MKVGLQVPRFHWPGNPVNIGFSSHSLEVAKKAVTLGQFETVQFPLNFVAREAADELVGLAKDHDHRFRRISHMRGGGYGYAT